MQPITVAIRVNLTVHSQAHLRLAAEDISGESCPELEDCIANALINPANPPVDTGFEILNKQVEACGDHFRVTVACHIYDIDQVMKEAVDRYMDVWQDHHWQPNSPEEALYEILIASNASPAPIDLGFELQAFEPAPVFAPATARRALRA